VKPNKKRRIITVAVIVAVVAALAVAIPLTIGSLTTQAKEAATQYKTDINAHIEKLVASTPKERLTVFPAKAELKEVPFGEDLSSEYKEAKAFQTRYNPLIDDNLQFIKERYTAIDFPQFLRDLTTTLNLSLPDSTLEITDEASLNAAKDYVAALQTKSDGYKKHAATLKDYVFAEKYREDQTGVVDALEGMSQTWADFVSVTNEYIDLAVRTMEVDKSGNKDDLTQLEADMAIKKDEVVTKTTQLREAYGTYIKSESQYMSNLVNGIVTDEYIQSLQAKADALNTAVFALQDDIKK